MAWRKVWKSRRKGVRKDAWLIRWYDNFDKMRAKTFHGTTREADEECRRMEHELNDGALGQRRKIEWLKFCEDYLADLSSYRRPRTVKDYKDVLAALTAACRPQHLDEITIAVLRDFVRTRTEKRSPATRNKLIRTLRAILGWAIPQYLKDNPANSVEFADEPEHDTRTLTPAEFERVLQVGAPRGQAVLLLGTCCGLRREEIAVLRWDDVDLDAAQVRVRNSEWHTTKSGRQRTVLIPPALTGLLASLKRTSQSDFIFPDVYLSYRELPNVARQEWSRRYRQGLRAGRSRVEARKDAWKAVTEYQKLDRPITVDRLTDLIPRLIKKAGLPHCTLHDLRRTFCTYLAACGTDPLAAQKLAGHSSPAVTAKHYVGVVSEMLKTQEKLPHWRVSCDGGDPTTDDAA